MTQTDENLPRKWDGPFLTLTVNSIPITNKRDVTPIVNMEWREYTLL